MAQAIYRIIAATLFAVFMAIPAAAKDMPTARIVFSGNLEGEVTPCGCKHNKGGLPWRGGFLNTVRKDTMATLTVEMGNFSPKVTDTSAPARHLSLQQFYVDKHYDAVALSHAETQFGLVPWESMAAEGVPIVVSNLFHDKRGKKPLFDTYVLEKKNGVRFAVIGFMSQKAFNYLGDKMGLYFTSPFEMEKFVRKVSKKADHVTLMGDFSLEEADSLAKVYPYVDLILASAAPAGKPVERGGVVIMSAQARGQVGEYMDWHFGGKSGKDSYEVKRETIDDQFDKVPVSAVSLETSRIK